MSAQIDPARPPVPGAALILAEAALQRQGSLLGAGRTPASPTGAQGIATPEAAGLPTPVLPDRVSLSPQAMHALGTQPPAADAARATAGAAARPAANTQADAAPRWSALLPQSPAPAGTAAKAPALPPTAWPATGVAAPVQTLINAALPPTAWPATGVAAPVQTLINAMVRHMTQGGLSQRVLSVQPWPASLVQQLDGTLDAPSNSQDSTLPVLQTWLVRQGSMQTAEGTRTFTLALKVPVPWLQQQPIPAAPPEQAGTLSLAFAGRPQTLQMGAFALVLQATETPARTSALLMMEFAPQVQVSVYGRDMLQARQDPWVQMAVLQASGHLPRDEDLARDREAGLCQTAGCPYTGRAACPQPFCPALQVVTPVAAVDAPAGGTDDPRTA